LSTALFAFEQPAPARRAAERLQSCGLAAGAVRLHLPAESPGDRAAAAVDEQATGGLLTNVAGLFGAVFEWGDLPIDSSAYAATVRRGGAVVSVEAGSLAERAEIDTVMGQAQPALRSEWFDFPGEPAPTA
jgi:hypothetical protein